MSWDDEDFQPPPVALTGEFDDEDTDGAALDWEAQIDDAKKKAEEIPDPSAGSTEKKIYPKVSSKKKRGLQIEREKKEKERQKETAQPVTPLTSQEKQARQAAVEESDLQNAVESLSVRDGEEMFGVDTGEDTEQKNVFDVFVPGLVPESEKDFESYAQMLGKRITPYEESFHFLFFMKALLKEATREMSPEDLHELSALLSVIRNEKISAAKKKKKKKKTTTVHTDVSREDIIEDEYDFLS